MSRTEAGKKVLAAADKGQIDLAFSTRKTPGLYGEARSPNPLWKGRADVYIPSTQNGRDFKILNTSVRGYEHTAATAIHEGLHALGVGGSRRAEALVRLSELQMHGIPIDMKAIRQVLSDMKGHYDDLPWQQGSSIDEFPGVRF